MRALSKGVNKGRCFAMKMIYEAPAMYAEAFAPNQYVAACKDPQDRINIDPMTVRCQSDGHKNTAKDYIFFDVTESCTGKYDPSITNDKCHYWPISGNNMHGSTSSGTGIVNGVWGTGNSGQGKEDWFYEDLNNSEWIEGNEGGSDDRNDSFWGGITQAFKGFFKQGTHYHLFYAKIDSISQYNLS